SRTAPFAMAAALLVLVVGSRFDARVVKPVLAGVVVSLCVIVTVPAVFYPHQGANPDSVPSRFRRIDIVTREVADRPYEGLGLSGVAERGVNGTDSSVSLLYAGAGVPGV